MSTMLVPKWETCELQEYISVPRTARMSQESGGGRRDSGQKDNDA